MLLELTKIELEGKKHIVKFDTEKKCFCVV